jgi:hypothetical protein
LTLALSQTFSQLLWPFVEEEESKREGKTRKEEEQK